MGSEEQETAKAGLAAIPLVAAADETQVQAPAPRGFAIPKIVDYVIVAIFMYFTL